ncbi:spore germination protein [Jeotgalibacillus proteolyticus]|uniref:Spore germination protein n=1 Tax=Jeotgalibacillus proteolyticus TaxID=2082395 RepID=A0A2S5GDR8_9BACL|nr:spore germination protein [Jeotgalibacillus proteolyticus]PPA71187.1 spore germination protein [Jeotgalibacillus proteolyticus]
MDKDKRINQDKKIIEMVSIPELFKEVSFFLGNTQDFIKRDISVDEGEAFCMYIETLVDRERLEELLEWFQRSMWEVGEVATTSDFQIIKADSSINDIGLRIVKGEAVLWILNDNGWTGFSLICPLNRFRAIEEPKNEQVVRGSHAGFNESVLTNINQIRSKMRSKNLVVRYLTIGKETNSTCVLIYLDNIANQMVVEEYIMRVQAIDSDMAFSIGYIEEFIEDNSWSPFPQFLNTERPDRVAANLAEGRIALMMEGSPTALIGPVNFFAFYQSPDDYNGRFLVGTFYRLLRILSFVIAVFLPALYIAVIGFHFEILPDDLALPARRAVEGVPYRPIVEALLLELTIELIREAGIRLPNPIGQTIGIVGGLVIGDAVVNAGLISNLMIIVVALTAISSFVVPSVEMNTTVRILRFPFMLLASGFGFYGIAIGLMLLTIHLVKLESLRSPYLTPLAPFHISSLKDMFIRMPSWLQNKRPPGASPIDKKRQGDSRWWKNEREK